jgi:hypothetical protein
MNDHERSAGEEAKEIFDSIRKRYEDAAEFDRELFAVAPWWDDTEASWWQLACMLSRRYEMSAETIVRMNASQLRGLFRDVLSSPRERISTGDARRQLNISPSQFSRWVKDSGIENAEKQGWWYLDDIKRLATEHGKSTN